MYVLKDILQRYNLYTKKSLGQNFILDTNILNKIAKIALSGVHPACVLEVGPGPGGLTKALLEQNVPSLIAVEKDDRCVNALTELQQEYPQMTICHEDALDFCEEKCLSPICVVANLPYNISTGLLVKWLKKIHLFSQMTLMFQKEVADRLCAKVGDSQYGRLSVLTQWLCDVSEEMVLPPTVFIPRPKVTSALVRIVPKKNYPKGVQFHTMERLTMSAFGQRRKMIRSSLKSVGDPLQLCAVANISPALRAEDVSVEAYCQMALFIQEQEKK